MIATNFTFNSGDGTEIFVYKWMPKDLRAKGVVQIAHGMAEHAARYEKFASLLTENGYIVYANDHRGHGKTAGSVENLGYLGDKDGFEWLVRDLHSLSKIIINENPSLQLFLFGHSMGSFAAQRYIMDYGNELSGVMLSGSNGKQGMILRVGSIIAKLETIKHSKKHQSVTMDNLIFGSYNKTFKPNRTNSDWISRDIEEVDKYINDPYCGTVFTAGFFYDFLTGLIKIEDKNNLNKIPKNLPILIFSGDKDPVGKNGKGIIDLYNRYKNNGIKNVKYVLYKDGRHEMLNELNRDEVMEDIVQWLDSNLI